MVHSDENIEVVYAASVVQWEGLGEKILHVTLLVI